MSQFLESQKRANLASYSAAKTVDAAVPKTTRAPAAAKGSAPAKPTFSKDPEVARAEIVKRALANRSSE